MVRVDIARADRRTVDRRNPWRRRSRPTDQAEPEPQSVADSGQGTAERILGCQRTAEERNARSDRWTG